MEVVKSWQWFPRAQCGLRWATDDGKSGQTFGLFCQDVWSPELCSVDLRWSIVLFSRMLSGKVVSLYAMEALGGVSDQPYPCHTLTPVPIG